MPTNPWFTAQITDEEGKPVRDFASPVSKVVCVGRNYVAHAKELNNPVPSQPLLFIKPNTSLVRLQGEIKIPVGDSDCHHELELAILIGDRLKGATPQQCINGIAGVGLALDLTLRELQSQLKKSGKPWEKAKGFDGACPVSGFLPFSHQLALNSLQFALNKNGEPVQQGHSKNMIFPIDTLLSDISSHFTLLPGDIVLTGTPEGVGALNPGDELELSLQRKPWAQCQIAAR